MTVAVADPGGGLYDDFKREQNLKPHAVQEKFLELPDEIFEALYGGAAYGGKSWLLTLLPLFRGFYKFQGFKGIILRRKFPDLEKEIIRLSKIYYPATGAKYNEQKHSWEWPQYHSYLDFGHVQHDSDIESYDSSQYNYCAYDELTHFSPRPYFYLVGSRVRPSSSFNIAIVRNGTNPGGIGQNFVYDRFVKPAEDGYRVIKDRATGLSRIFIPAKAEDNPYGMEYDPLYVKKLEILKETSEADYRAKRYGDWHAFKGSVFTTFRPIRFPNEPDNALHVIEEFQIPEWWPEFCQLTGENVQCVMRCGAIPPDRRVYAYRERHWTGRDIPFWASEIREINDECREVIAHTTLCGSAWQNRGQGTIADQFQEYSGLVPHSSESTPGSRIAGLQNMHDFMRWERKITLKTKEEFYDLVKAQEIYRRFGPEALDRYRKQFLDGEEESNLPKLQIFKSCKILIETIPLAVYDEKKPEMVAEFDGDDPIDNLNYFCRTARKMLLGEIGNMNLEVRKQEIIAEANASQDMTRFYRQMECLEHGNNITRRPGRLGRRRTH